MRSTPVYLAQLRHDNTSGSQKKRPVGVQKSPIMPSISHRPEFQNDFKRLYIYKYIIKYTLKKNSVTNTMWNKCCGFLFLFLCCCCCYFIHGSSPPALPPSFFFLLSCRIPAETITVQQPVRRFGPVLPGLSHENAPGFNLCFTLVL